MVVRQATVLPHSTMEDRETQRGERTCRSQHGRAVRSCISHNVMEKVRKERAR